MNYEDFKQKRKEILEKNTSIIDLSENNLYQFMKNKLNLDDIKGENINGHVNGNVHRCHLVEDWLNHFSLSESYKNFIGVSDGVRHSLELLMTELKDKKWYIPRDVYPVYQEKADKNLIKDYKDYSTLYYDNVFKVNGIPEDVEVILTINPFKPYGRKMLGSELENLRHWLSGNQERRLIVDCVYMTDIEDNTSLLNLYNETGQVYLLFSLSKTWLLPKIFGLTFIAQKDNLHVKNIFKSLKANTTNLKIAYDALNNYISRPAIIKEALKTQIEVTSKKGLEFGLIYNEDNPSYLFCSNKDFDYWLNKGFLTIPASVFGAEKGVVISTLTNN